MSTAARARVEAAEALLERCRRKLAHFVSFINGWSLPPHQVRICEALERVEATPDSRLVITMPPRHGKTEIGNIGFTAWALGRGRAGLGPIKRVAIASYGAEFAAGLSASVRDHFADDEDGCRMVWPQAQLGAQRSSDRWAFEGVRANRPSCVSTGTGGPLTGKGADLIIIDDPYKNSEEADSPGRRAQVWRWWTSVARTRLQPGGRVVVIQTRWHDDDLAGRLLQRPGWDLLHLPAISDEGAALWPAHYPLAALEAIQEDLGPRDFQALYQGNPVPDVGGIWKREWFDAVAYEGAPAKPVLAITAWDTALETTDGSDYTAWVRMGLDVAGHFWVLGAGRARLDFPDLVRAIDYGHGSPLSEAAVIERKASGHSALQAMRKGGRRPVIAIEAEVSKAARARPVTVLAESGRVHVPSDKPFGELLLGEVCRFPAAPHDDMHDAFVHALTYLSRKAEELADEGEPDYLRIGGPR